MKTLKSFDKKVNKHIFKYIKHFQIKITHPVVHIYSKNIFSHI